MISKRDVLKTIAKQGDCGGISCNNCPYYDGAKRCPDSEIIKKIGAMAILRMFPEKPMLKDGTKLKFSDGSTAVIETRLHGMGDYEYVLIIDGKEESMGYLIGKIWKVVY